MDTLFDEKAYFRKKKNYKKRNPAQLSTTFGVRIPNELAAAIDKLCVNGVTRPEVIRLALYEYMEKHS
tara:strand:- start:87 stop:290 length:204 start_codon:yes stop_codon:yes gene_type:complete